MNATSVQSTPLASAEIAGVVEQALTATPIIDMHTHLYSPAFGDINLWGIDNLLTYHYLEAELFRASGMLPEDYWKLSKPQQADIIWQELFVKRPPVSEATRGAVRVLQSFGLPLDAPTLQPARAFFAEQKISEHIDRVFALAGIQSVVMTNDPLDPDEGAVWDRGVESDARFHPVLRLDRVLNRWPEHWHLLQQRGYAVDAAATGKSIVEIRRWLLDVSARMKPVYMAVSLPDSFVYPEGDLRTRLLREAVLPACRELDIPVSLMIGVRYQVNPRLRLAGDAVGKADLRSLERLCVEFPDNRILTSLLSRENQHELTVYARKFANLMPFGCWWFLNNPSIVEEMTRERLEMLGATFIPQHSDARILEQVIYKWHNTRRTIGPILANAYTTLLQDGYPVRAEQIRDDIHRLFVTNFENWTPLQSTGR